MRTWLVASLLALLAPAVAAASGPGPEPVPGVTRPVILVGNNWDGTTDIVDPETYERLDRVNVVPDLEERLDELAFSADRFGFFLAVRELIGEGHDQLNDDVFSSNDGRTIFVSRPSLADVVAIDLATEQIKWRAPVDGYRSDHMAISADGRRLLVSASTGNVVHEIDTATGARTGAFASGDSPHENTFSKDGETIYHASIGRVYLPTDRPAVINSAAKGGEFFQVVDADTLEVKKRIVMSEKMAEAGYPNFSAAVRPMTLSPDERYVYFQLSFFFGFVEYDLVEERVTRVARLPVGETVQRLLPEEYLLDSAQHGIALDPTGRKFCVAGTMNDYGAIVDRKTLVPNIVADDITKPYWSTNSADGKYCYISGSGDDNVVVISYATEKVVHTFPVGFHPQRVRNGVVRVDQYPQGKFGERFRLGVYGGRRLAFRGGDQRVGCRARRAVALELLRCRVQVRTRRGRLVGSGERFQRGRAQFTVGVELNRRGRRLLRRGKLRRAVVVARGTDSVGRRSTARRAVRIGPRS